METIKSTLNNDYIGFIVGLIGPSIGFSIYYLIQFSHLSFGGFIAMVIDNKSVQAPVLSLSLLFNVLVFFISTRLKTDRLSRGIILATVLYIPLMIYLKFIR